MRYTVTGSRPPPGGYTPDEVALGLLAMRPWWYTDSLCTGGCIGRDAEAMAYASSLGMEVITMLPIKKDYTDWEAVNKYSSQVIETRVGYWARDALEVAWAQRVIALPLYERARSGRYSGTWHTWDVARDQGKDHLLVVTRPTSEQPFVRGWRPNEFRVLLAQEQRRQLELFQEVPHGQ